jgi:homoserine kinase
VNQALRAVRVRVPCSTSNLGSGFDVLGLALNRYLQAGFQPGGEELRVVRSGTLDEHAADEEPDFLLGAFTDGLREVGVTPTGVLRIHSEIPVARGLGSSAAAHVAGYVLAQACLGWEADQDAAFRYAAEQEGHGDNAAPCALGGFRAVVPGPRGLRPMPLELSERVGFAYAAPSTAVSTEEMRKSLPKTVRHGRAVEGVANLVALILGLRSGDPDLIRVGVDDRLHVPYRLKLIPQGEAVMNAAVATGAWAVTISGSGSGLLALCPPGAAREVANAMRQKFDEAVGDGASVGFPLTPDYGGVKLGR